jgi:hypothetical protein
MDETINLKLPYIVAAQAQKHVTHNEALRALDAIVQLMVLDKDLAAPPGSPAEGSRYIVAASPTGAWAGQAGRIAAFQDGAWAFYAPLEGWLAWIADENAAYVFDGATWGALSGGGASVNPTPLVGVNATADTTNRLSVSSPASLFNHEGAGHQLKINKNAPANTASLLFQTAFSGRAEYGLAGDDDFHVKVSPDGSTWHEAMIVDKDTGAVSFPNTSIGGGGGGDLLSTNNLSDVSNAATARTNLGLAIGTNVQAYDAELLALAGLTSAANKLPYFTGSGTAALADLTSFARTLLDDADAATARATLGLGTAATQASSAFDAAGTAASAAAAAVATHEGLSDPHPQYLTSTEGNAAYQPLDADLTALAGLTSAANKLPYFTGSGAAALADLTSFGRSLVDDANAAAAVSTLGLDNTKIATLTYVIDGGGSTITTGLKGFLEVPFACTITRATLLADQSGSIVVDVWKDTYANFPPTNADSIAASAKPTITTAVKSQDATLTGWTTAIGAGDVLAFNVDSVTSIQRATLSLRVTKT